MSRAARGATSPRRHPEPNASLPLRWGAYLDRQVLGTALIVGGALGLQGSNTYILPLLLGGTVLHAVGWAVLPAPGWRRVIASLLGTTAVWLLLIGPTAAWVLTLFLAAWLLVRRRPPRSWVAILFPIAYGIAVPAFVHEMRHQLVVLAIGAAVLVGSALIARSIAGIGSSRALSANAAVAGSASSEPRA